jgi:hypothetical protein
MAKTRVHNEWFQPIAKTTCPCGMKKTKVFTWGEYVRVQFRTIDHFCQSCFASRVIPRLLAHAKSCGCSFELQAKSGHSIPDWIKMPDTCKVKHEQSLSNSPRATAITS